MWHPVVTQLAADGASWWAAAASPWKLPVAWQAVQAASVGTLVVEWQVLQPPAVGAWMATRSLWRQPEAWAAARGGGGVAGSGRVGGRGQAPALVAAGALVVPAEAPGQGVTGGAALGRRARAQAGVLGGQVEQVAVGAGGPLGGQVGGGGVAVEAARGVAGRAGRHRWARWWWSGQVLQPPAVGAWMATRSLWRQPEAWQPEVGEGWLGVAAWVAGARPPPLWQPVHWSFQLKPPGQGVTGGAALGRQLELRRACSVGRSSRWQSVQGAPWEARWAAAASPWK